MRDNRIIIPVIFSVLLLSGFGLYQSAMGTTPFDPVPIIISNPNGATSDYDEFGYAVSTNGEEIVVGAPSLRNSAAYGPGSAFLFDSSGVLISELHEPSPSSGEVFGKSVSIDSSHALVGATGVSGNAGAAYDYNLLGSHVTTYPNHSPGGVDIFGEEVDVLGDYVLIGVPLDDSLAFDSGIAYLIQRSTGDITTIGNPTPAGGDVFGASLALGPDFAVIASESHDGVAPHIGEVYIFDYSGGVETHIPNPSPIIYDSFGVDVATDGTDVLISSPAGDGRSSQPGTVYLYDRSGALLLTIPNPEPTSLDRFGHSIDMSGDFIVVGAPQDDFGASNAGSVYVFDKTGTLQQTIRNPSPVADDNFGFSVSLSGNLLVVGTPRHDTNPVNSGIAYLYTAPEVISNPPDYVGDENSIHFEWTDSVPNITRYPVAPDIFTQGPTSYPLLDMTAFLGDSNFPPNGSLGDCDPSVNTLCTAYLSNLIDTEDTKLLRIQVMYDGIPPTAGETTLTAQLADRSFVTCGLEDRYDEPGYYYEDWICNPNPAIEVYSISPLRATINQIVIDTVSFSPTPTDTVPPVITLLGDNPQKIHIGSAYTELGATASDDVDGNISANIVIDTSAVNTGVLGSYTVTYDVSDAAGNPATQVTRTVDVVETKFQITKNTIGGDGSFSFNFDNIGGLQIKTIPDTSVSNIYGPELFTPGVQFTITENVPAGWNLISSDCEINGVSVGGVTFTPDVGDFVECIYVNEIIPTDPVIPDSADVAGNVEIGDGTVLGENVVVNKDTVIGEFVTVGDDTEIAKDVVIGDNTSIGSDATVAKDVSIDSDVTIGDNVSIAKDVTIGNGAVIGNNVTIEKNVTISPGAVVPDGTTIKKDTVYP